MSERQSLQLRQLRALSDFLRANPGGDVPMSEDSEELDERASPMRLGFSSPGSQARSSAGGGATAGRRSGDQAG